MVEELHPLYDHEERVNLINILINYFFGLSRVDQAMEPEHRLSESELLKLHFAVKELKQHKPVQYITGFVEFMEMRLSVNKSVLIPRPETEELVAKIISNLQNHPPHTVLDVGTGSGCIALALKKAFIKASVTAIDVSREALAVAETNAEAHHLSIDFLQMDMLKGKETQALPFFDLIVSNPPYVTRAEKIMMNRNVADYEPELALFVENDAPLLFYEAIASFSKKHLNLNGKLYFETNERYADEVAKMLVDIGYTSVDIEKDIHGKERFVIVGVGEWLREDKRQKEKDKRVRR